MNAILRLFGLDAADHDASPSKPSPTSRRDALRQTGQGVAGLALAAVPLALGATRPAQGRPAGIPTGIEVHGVLNFALLLEYLEDEYYQIGLDTGGLIPASGRTVYAQISSHERAHVEFLRSAISSLGETPIEKPTFDFTAGGAFAPFTNYDQFLALSQGFEDTGVRAYKGQAPNLYSQDGSTNTVLTAALQIHSVEARHAAEVRRLRRMMGVDVHEWIVGDDVDVAALQPVYAGEANTTHLGTDATGVTNKNREQTTEAFDEPLTREDVEAIAGLFIQS